MFDIIRIDLYLEVENNSKLSISDKLIDYKKGSFIFLNLCNEINKRPTLAPNIVTIVVITAIEPLFLNVNIKL
jgi:hypothetical protein